MQSKDPGAIVNTASQPQNPIAVVPIPIEGFFTPQQYGGESLSGPSFIRRQKEDAAPCFPVSIMAWLLLRDVCDWFDLDYTQDGEEACSIKRSISIRLLLLFVPVLAIADFILNLILCITVLPLMLLKCCYPFKDKLVTARKKGSPDSCCLLHEACDPVMRVMTSFVLFLSSPVILCGICSPKMLVKRYVYWVDGHTAGYLYFDRSSLCCRTQFPFGLFFRNRAVGDVMS